ncbi:S-antigen, C-terminal domain-containing protein [Gigaspora rosea]|uniref:S-antigen, C-terminal domain-containing protein n=1 Tax=Gigaspora rosea TaxID=44941 RepID=A0A397UNV2_9GLOM|nr:S-antigen, C-terminal domain-containing protein [Gigaspora rosea]
MISSTPSVNIQNPSFTNLPSAQISQSQLSQFSSSSFVNITTTDTFSRTSTRQTNIIENGETINTCLEIKLVEPVIFFSKPEESVGCILRGDLILYLSKPTRIRKLELNFVGTAETVYNEERKKFKTEIISHKWKFIIPQEEDEEQQQQEPKRKKKFLRNPFRKSTIAKLPAGIHTFSFEKFLPGNLPETINTALGTVSYELYAKASRSKFLPKLRLHQPIEILRTLPDHINSQGIAVAREFNDMLSYEISIPKKAYPLGQSIPIDMKICPYIKKLEVKGVKVDLVEKISCSSPLKPKITDVRIGSTQVLNIFGENRLIEDHEEGDVGNVIYQQTMNLDLPNCAAPLHYSCNTPLITISHDLKFAFNLTLPQDPPKKAELKISLPITILSCKAVDDYVVLPSYEDDNYFCPCDPEYLRMARLVLGEDVGYRLENICKFSDHNLSTCKLSVHNRSTCKLNEHNHGHFLNVDHNYGNILNVDHNYGHFLNVPGRSQDPPTYEASITESYDDSSRGNLGN